MTIARKLQAVPTPQPPITKAADVEAELTAAQAALSAASAAVDSARAALDAEPDFAKRPELREIKIQAEKDLEEAQDALVPIQARLAPAQRHEDEQAAIALARGIGNAAQLREADADADEFVRVIGGAVERFFERMSTRNLAFRREADVLNALWERLGHEHRIPGVQLALGTGTADIPARVDLEPLHNFEVLAHQKLTYQHPQASPVAQATRQFLLGALDHTRTLRALKETVAHNHTLRAELAVLPAKGQKP